jgi:uncharacterized cupin superfamily protein
MPDPITFSATGPQDFMTAATTALPTAKLIEGQPFGRDHAYFERPEAKLKVGLWRSSAYTEWYESYPCDEFMVVLEGEVTIESDSFCETYGPGAAFLIPKGFQGYWRQPVAMVKYYAIVE